MKRIYSIIFVISFCVIVINFPSKFINSSEYENEMPSKPIEKVLEEHTNELMSIKGVIGTAEGLCNSKPCIKVYVIKKTPQLTQRIPTTLEGYPVVIEETGEFRALPEN